MIFQVIFQGLKNVLCVLRIWHARLDVMMGCEGPSGCDGPSGSTLIELFVTFVLPFLLLLLFQLIL